MNKLQPIQTTEFSPATRSAIVYRQAATDEVPLLFSVILRAYAEFWGKLNPRSGTYGESAESIAAKVDKGGAVTAWCDNEMVGTVIYEPRPDFMYFGRLAVLPAWRGQGIAKGLIGEVERKAQEVGLTRVQIGVRLVLASHQEYYAALGYQPLVYECHPGFTEPTSVTMEKVLSP